MSVDVKKLSNYNEKRVTLTFKNDEGEVVTQEGKVESASEIGVLFKEKGKSSYSIVEPENVEAIELLPERDPNISSRKLQPIKLGKARAHLADRHGVNLKWINGTSEQDAFDYHEAIDHKKEDLGHYHAADEPAAPAAESTETPALADGEEFSNDDEGAEASD